MVYLLKVALFAELVVGRSGFFGDNSGFVQLFLECSELVGKFCVLSIYFRNLGQISKKASISLMLAPFLLECL